MFCSISGNFVRKSGDVMTGNLNLGLNSLILHNGEFGGIVRGSDSESNVICLRNIGDTTVAASRINWLALSGDLTLSSGRTVDEVDVSHELFKIAEQDPDENAHGGDTNPHVHKTYTITGGTLGLKGCVLVKVCGTCQGNGGVKDYTIKLGASTVASWQVPADAGDVDFFIDLILYNYNNDASQRSMLVGSNEKEKESVPQWNISVEDTSGNLDLTLNVTNADAGDASIIRCFNVRIMPS